MSYMLQTLNRGKVRAGYEGIIMQAVRMGVGIIPTAKFCRSVAEFVTGRIEGYEFGLTWDPTGQAVRIGPSAYTLSMDLAKARETYAVGVKEFAAFAAYLFNGGALGWGPDQARLVPDFVRDSVALIRHAATDDHQNNLARLILIEMHSRMQSRQGLEEGLK